MALLAALFIGTSARAQNAAECAPPATIVSMLPPHLSEVQSDIREPLREIVERRLRGGHPAQGLAFGHYDAVILSTYKANVSARDLPGGRMCLGLRSIRITFGLVQRRIYLARELEKYPCVAGHVVRHEGRHVRRDEDLMAAYNPRFWEIFTKLMNDGLPVVASNPTAAQTAMKEGIDQIMDAVRERFSVLRISLQAKVDEEDELDAVSRACGDEVRRLLSEGK